MMTDDRFNDLMDELIGGVPMTMAVNRLQMLIYHLVHPDSKESAPPEARFEAFVRSYRSREDQRRKRSR